MTNIDITYYSGSSVPSEVIGRAISESIRENRSTHIETVGDATALHDSLAAECEGETDANHGAHEYWGADVDGAEWRIHVSAARRAASYRRQRDY